VKDAEKKELIGLMKKDVLYTWLFMFGVQILYGSWAMYTLAPKYPDWEFFEYIFILLFGAALIGTVLTIVFYILLFVVGMIAVGITMWLESRQ
jgi:hypothetical protein